MFSSLNCMRHFSKMHGTFISSNLYRNTHRDKNSNDDAKPGYILTEGSRKKSSSLNGRAIKRGVGGKGPANKEKKLFCNFFQLCCHLKMKIILL